METSHVIRGEEWLPSMPARFVVQIWLGKHRICSFTIDNETCWKIIKRDDKMGFPVFPLVD
jgi:glutamyl-tRNA synthetase